MLKVKAVIGSMSLPDNQLAVLDNLIKTGRRVVVVLFGGSVVELPFVDHVNAVLHMFCRDKTEEQL